MNEQLEKQPQSAQQIPPPNYLVWAILTTILCCLPFGIVSIVYAAQVNSKWTAGDYEGAKQSSKNAKIWAWVSFGVALAGAIIWAILTLVIGIAGLGLDALASFNV
ncbi:Interferon-induced transmembrane protein [Tangfeifania diversioriginum]|uniref:Interferon-induced transmembrane protein n=1 Tax=Tangfeifania diversioriginum TaxID=1168035 RepID=A0A1M6L4T9_9BACT|nr:CD225/dispanin family protein [Tangfeifania diversioriginum]SHJ66228.1 Interferon-induced transmembrane protein [Tangfeifania diversioriginum]